MTNSNFDNVADLLRFGAAPASDPVSRLQDKVRQNPFDRAALEKTESQTEVSSFFIASSQSSRTRETRNQGVFKSRVDRLLRKFVAS